MARRTSSALLSLLASIYASVAAEILPPTEVAAAAPDGDGGGATVSNGRRKWWDPPRPSGPCRNGIGRRWQRKTCRRCKKHRRMSGTSPRAESNWGVCLRRIRDEGGRCARAMWGDCFPNDDDEEEESVFPPSFSACVGDRLDPGGTLRPGEFVCSPGDGGGGGWRYLFGLSDDADLSLWDGRKKLWSALTSQEVVDGTFAVMQGDGNLVVYGTTTAAGGGGGTRRVVLWASNTDRNDGAFLLLDFDDDGGGDPKIVDRGGERVLWRPRECNHLVRQASPSPPPPGPSPPGLVPVDASTLRGKVMAGYQGWFGTACEGEAGSGRWRHWGASGGDASPGPGTVRVDMWPDVSEYGPDELCGTEFATPGNVNGGGGLFSSLNVDTVERHVKWMYDYGIDGVFVQRFISEMKTMRCDRDKVLKSVRRGSEQYGRVFVNMYDISGADAETVYQDIKTDWMHLVDLEEFTQSDRYLHHNGLPLVAIWGFGFRDRVGEPGAVLDLINWFRNNSKKKYRAALMGGAPTGWRTLEGDSKTDDAWAQVYRSFDVISPWTVGRFRDVDGADDYRKRYIGPDLADCQQEGNEYMPVVFPGFSFSNSDPDKPFNEIPREGGRFFWRQIFNAVDGGSTQLYVAMFDEVDEGTAIFKVAATSEETPTEGKFVTLDQDGFDVPNDWFMQLTGNATAMLRTDGAVQAAMPALPGE